MATYEIAMGQLAGPISDPAQAPSKISIPNRRYSPAVAMLARENAVDLSGVRGSGLGGRVTKKDVQRLLEAGPPPATPTGASAVEPLRGDRVIPVSRIRQLIADSVTRSKTTIPHAMQAQEVDMSGVVANLARNRAEFKASEGFSLTSLPYVIRSTAAALREHPGVNSSFNETEIVLHGHINIGVSICLDDMLVVPVVRDADRMSVAGIARAMHGFGEAAQARRLNVDDLHGATFTLSDSGTWGTLFSYSVINPGQAGILTMEAIQERPVAVQGMIGIKPLMPLCFSLDHRVMDGLLAARFLSACRRGLEAVTAASAIY